MDLSEPLRSIAPGLDAAVLTTLAGVEGPMSAAQILRVSRRGSRGGQAHVLDRLVEHGLITTLPSSRGHLYRFNREHVLADAVLLAVRARTEFRQRLTQAVAALEPQPRHASLFGSLARGEAGVSSDIDLLVIGSSRGCTDAWAEQLAALSEQVLMWTGNALQAFAFTTDDIVRLLENDEPIIESWRADSLLLHGESLPRVLKEASASGR